MEPSLTERVAGIIDRRCLILCARKEIALIETVLIVLDKREKKRCERLAEPLNMGKRLLVADGARFSFPKKWMEDCWKRGEAVSAFIRKPSPEDLQYMDMFYILYSGSRWDWMKGRLQRHIYSTVGIRKEDDLASTLNRYLKSNGYVLSPLRIGNKFNGAKYLSDSNAVRKLYSVLGNMDILSETLLRRALRLQVVSHELVSKRRYVSGVRNLQIFSGAQLRILNKKGESSSGCIFLHIKKNSEQWFIKGNESPLFHGIKNEINIQKRLSAHMAGQHYLHMKLYDPGSCWIGFPYEKKRTLKHVLAERRLTGEEQKKLGKFILVTLDELYEMNLIHRDYRIENIMVDEDAGGSIQSFTLFDFGCSVLDGSDIWKKRTFWNRYLSKEVCGEGRYNRRIVDDAAAAHVVYIKCGGNPDDCISREIESRIGRLIV